MMDLDQVELRILGCLIEKQRTTPDQYPLSLNALRLACNQTTNRDPVVQYDETTIREAQRVERQRVLVGRRALLLDQAAQDAQLDLVQVHHPQASGAACPRRTSSNATGFAVITPSTHSSMSRRQTAGDSPSLLSHVCHA